MYKKFLLKLAKPNYDFNPPSRLFNLLFLPFFHSSSSLITIIFFILAFVAKLVVREDESERLERATVYDAKPNNVSSEIGFFSTFLRFIINQCEGFQDVEVDYLGFGVKFKRGELKSDSKFCEVKKDKCVQIHWIRYALMSFMSI